MKPEETIDFHIRWAWAKMQKAYNAQAAKLGATMAMGYALLSIDKEGTLSTKLGPKMGMEPTGMTRLLKSLERDGYIERTPDAKDGRKVWVKLTPKGKEYREYSRSIVLQMNERIQKNIDPKKLTTFFEVIQDINHQLETTELNHL
jgi:MarR family transcriptional regulator, organic hydroperoxide resistance regulator